VTKRLRHFLVPLDGSRLAEVVLPTAYDLAAACDARITLLHIIEHDAPATVHGEPHLDNVETADAYLAAVAHREQRTGVPTTTHVHTNPAHDVARAIGEHAEELGVDLIVLATHGRGGLRGLLFGRIAQQVLHHTATPVLLIRPVEGEAAPTLRRGPIVVPLDGTPAAEAALPLAQALAAATGTHLHLVRVVPTVQTLTTGRDPAATFTPIATAALLDLEEPAARDYLAEVADRGTGGIPTTTEVRRGEVAAELAAAVTDSEAGLVVMATHGRAGISGHLAGSVATRLLSRLDRPLVLTGADGR